MENRRLTERHIMCENCKYEWDMKSKRPNPRFISCPNCMWNVSLREELDG